VFTDATYPSRMADIASRLAADFLTSQGWGCILIAPKDGACTVNIRGIDARHKTGARIWFRKRRLAERVLETYFGQHRQARRHGGGLVVNAETSTVKTMIRDTAMVVGVAFVGETLVDDDDIDAETALVTKRIEAALARMKRDGSLKVLHRQYRAERTSGVVLPGYGQWLAARMRPVFASL
jgi:hypothetical protein